MCESSMVHSQSQLLMLSSNQLQVYYTPLNQYMPEQYKHQEAIERSHEIMFLQIDQEMCSLVFMSKYVRNVFGEWKAAKVMRLDVQIQRIGFVIFLKICFGCESCKAFESCKVPEICLPQFMLQLKLTFFFPTINITINILQQTIIHFEPHQTSTQRVLNFILFGIADTPIICKSRQTHFRSLLVLFTLIQQFAFVSFPDKALLFLKTFLNFQFSCVLFEAISAFTQPLGNKSDAINALTTLLRMHVMPERSVLAQTLQIEVRHEIKLLAIASLGCTLVNAVLMHADMLGEEVSTEAIVAIVDLFAKHVGRIGPCYAYLQTGLILEEQQFGKL